MNDSAVSALSYLVGTMIDLYVAAVLIRLLLQWVRADFYNPLCQFLVKVTNPVLVPLRRFVPSIGRLDTASVVLMLLLEIMATWIISRIGSTQITLQELVVFSAVKLIMALLMTYFFLIIAAVILSWIGQRTHHPVVPLVHQLTEPVLRPFRRFIPPIAGLDLSPLFALITIRFLILLLGW